jgi:2-octaprenyl-6-methoxyphenol hydroxylase
VAVAGGGPVGCAFALAVAGSGLSVAQISGDAAPADRPIALSHGSRLILERLGVWTSIRNTPIETIHVSQQGFGRTVMRCAELGLPALGYVTSYSELTRELAPRTSAVAGSLLDWKVDAKGISLRLSSGAEEHSMRAQLLVLADGGRLRVERVKDYQQQAIVAEVAVERPQGHVAWERFAREGPLALLPYGNVLALVWSMQPASATELIGLSDPDFLARLREAFGGRLGKFVTVSSRAVFPLSLRHGAVNPQPRVLSVGNAAQTLHPVAGQGLNLGLRDAWELAYMLLGAAKGEIGTDRLAARYARARRFDRYAGIGFTDFLVRVFSNSLPPLAAARGAGLAVLDAVSPARRFLARRMIYGARALP